MTPTGVQSRHYITFSMLKLARFNAGSFLHSKKEEKLTTEDINERKER